MITNYPIINFNSPKQKLIVPGVPAIKKKDYYVIHDKTMDGDAPKDFIAVYKYSPDNEYKRLKTSKWPKYIAKVGHKWYPSESIIELLLNRFGECFGLNMAESSICLIGGQLRFLSKYFLSEAKEELVHGAEIFAGYLGDKSFVEDIESTNLARDLFTLQFVEKAIKFNFPNDYEAIMSELVKLLLYDAYVGNNDRHFYNWGVIRSLNNSTKPVFSPIYDTARALFWNESDLKIKELITRKKDLGKYITKYCNQSRPKLGWEGCKNINHYTLVKYIFENKFYISQDQIFDTFSEPMHTNCRNILYENFAGLISAERTFLIDKCLCYRFETIKSLIHEAFN